MDPVELLATKSNLPTTEDQTRLATDAVFQDQLDQRELQDAQESQESTELQETQDTQDVTDSSDQLTQ